MERKLPFHRGVGVLIYDETTTSFFVQQKDNLYPFPEWRLANSFWGGAIENNETDIFALKRELTEELPDVAEILINQNPKKLRTYKVYTSSLDFFELTVFVLKLEQELFNTVAQTNVLEGVGRVLSRKQVVQLPWIWNTDFILEDFFNSL